MTRRESTGTWHDVGYSTGLDAASHKRRLQRLSTSATSDAHQSLPCMATRGTLIYLAGIAIFLRIFQTISALAIRSSSSFALQVTLLLMSAGGRCLVCPTAPMAMLSRTPLPFPRPSLSLLWRQQSRVSSSQFR
jgi:hypothetical protein